MKPLCLFLLTLMLAPLTVLAESDMPYFELSTSQVKERFLEVANNFKDAATEEEAMKYVSNPDHKGFSRAFRELHTLTTTKIADDAKVFTRNLEQVALINSRWSNGKESFIFMVWNRGQSAPQVDWKATYAYCVMGWEQLIKVRPELPIEVRASFTPSTYYNFHYSDDRVWQSFAISHNSLDTPLYAYINRDHKDYARVMRLFKSNKRSSFTARLAFSPDSTGPK